MSVTGSPPSDPSPSLMFLEARSDGRGVQVGLAAAVVLHLAAFAVTWPTLAGEARVVDTSDRRLFVVRPVRFEPPPPVPIEVPRHRDIRRVPIPDSTPEDPEPIREFESDSAVVDPSLASFDATDFVAPDPPTPIRDVVRVGVEVAPPEVLIRVTPRYPEIARRAGLQGAVVLDFLIGPDGTVRDLTVLRGLPLGLTEAAVEAARGWRFAPSTLDGRPVSVRYVLTITFRLQ